MTGKLGFLGVFVICFACASNFAIAEDKNAADPKVSADQAKATFAA
jgi:hypothetical protein